MKIDIDGYFFFKTKYGDLYLMIADEDHDIVFDYIKEKGIKNIMLSEIGGCSGEDLVFLENSYKFDKINIFFKRPVDLSKLHHQNKLTTLELGDALFDVDFNAFPLLEWLLLYGQKKEITSFMKGSKLKQLVVNQFLNVDLAFIQNCTKLERLELTNSRKLTSLSGLHKCSEHLQLLELYYLPKLQSLGAMANLPSLKQVFIENCLNLTDLSILENAKQLEVLSILNGREIESLRFIEKLPSFKDLYIGKKIKVKDGYIPSFANLVPN